MAKGVKGTGPYSKYKGKSTTTNKTLKRPFAGNLRQVEKLNKALKPFGLKAKIEIVPAD